jgi:CHAD domain-containing protein
MGPSGKWIDGLDPDAGVAHAARLSLAARLTAVAHWLPLAAYHAEQDIEHVHRLRVSTRRAMAALHLYRDWLPSRKRRRIKRRLKKIRRAAGDARDLDVLDQHIKRGQGERVAALRAEVKELREAAQPAILEVAEKCRRDDRFVRQIGELLDGICSRQDDDRSRTSVRFRDWAATELTKTADAFFSAVPENAADAKALHQFRIQTKALRYAIELLAPAFGPGLRRDTYPAVEELQGRLGAIQDCVAGAAHLRKWSRDAHSLDTCESLDHMAREQDKRFAELTAEFQEWWSPERVAMLKGGLQSANERLAVESSGIPDSSHSAPLAMPQSADLPKSSTSQAPVEADS